MNLDGILHPIHSQDPSLILTQLSCITTADAKTTRNILLVPEYFYRSPSSNENNLIKNSKEILERGLGRRAETSRPKK